MTADSGGAGAWLAAWQSRAIRQPNPALELLDLVTFDDVSGNVSTRITELHTTWFPLQAHHDLVLMGEGL